MDTVTVTNEYDLTLVRRGLLLLSQARTCEVQALVDTSRPMLILPHDVVERLGLSVAGYRNVHDAPDQIEAKPWVTGIKVEIRDREAVVSALVAPTGSVPVIGRGPIEEMDLVVDPISHELRPNPAPTDARKRDRPDTLAGVDGVAGDHGSVGRRLTLYRR